MPVLTENSEVMSAQLVGLHSAVLPGSVSLGSGFNVMLVWKQLCCSWIKYSFILWETSVSVSHTLSSSHARGVLRRTPFVQRQFVKKLRDHTLII